MVRSSFKQIATAVVLGAAFAGVQAAGITQISYAELNGQQGVQSIAFGGVNCEGNPPQPPSTSGCSIDQKLVLGNVTLGEHFVGQAVTANGDYDALTAPASLGGPLSLRAGDPGKNLYLQRVGVGGSVVLGGIGPAGSDEGAPLLDAAGTGALSVFFAGDQRKFGFEILNWDGGAGASLFLAFFDIRGNRIGDVISLDASSNATNPSPLAQGAIGLAFESTDINIAGVSIWNSDDSGINLQRMVFDQAGVRDGNVPEPGALLLAGLALVAAARVSRRR